MQFIVTQHAVDRWRERVAAYADAAGKEVLKAANEAVRVEMVPFRRVPGSAYYHHEESGCYFVCEVVNASLHRILTVRYERGNRHGRAVVWEEAAGADWPLFCSEASERVWLQKRSQELNNAINRSHVTGISREQVLAMTDEWDRVGTRLAQFRDRDKAMRQALRERQRFIEALKKQQEAG